MGLNNFNFAQPLWLLGLILIPCVWGWFRFFNHGKAQSLSGLRKFADPALLPHLVVSDRPSKNRSITGLLYAITIASMVVALADPRWDYKDIEAYSPSASMVILLDLSSTMNAQDVSPSRIIAGRQRVEDILQQSKGLKVGLIGFAEYPHLISPITDDLQTIKAFLPAVDTDLINKQGASLSSALKAAADLLVNEPGEKKSIFLVSDGNLGNDNYEKIVKALVGQNISVHVLGVGTLNGGPFRDQSGKLHKVKDQLAISKLNTDVLQKIARDGHGIYVEANYSDRGLTQLINTVQRDTSSKQAVTGKIRQWEDRYYIFLIPAALCFLYLLRQRALYGICLVVLSSMFGANDASALDFSAWFKNSEQQGQQLYSQGDFAAAAQTFKDPYQRGVALYRAGEFAAAEENFKAVQKPKIQNQAIYNTGNAQMQQKKWHAAINSYERVLEIDPEHADAKFNLELAKKMLAKNEDQEDKQDQHNKDDQSDQKDKNQQEKNQQEKEQESDKSAENKPEPENEQETGENDEKSNDQKNEQQSNQKDDQDKQNDARKADQQSNAADAQLQAEKDARAQQWLNRINSDIKIFLRNKFYIEDMLGSK